MEEFLNELSRPPKTLKSRNLTNTKEAAGLALVLTFSTLADEEPRIIFNLPNLTIPYIEPLEEFRPNPKPSQRKISPPKKPTPNRPIGNNCVFLSQYMPKIFAPPGCDHESPIFIPHQFDNAVLKQLPMTKCNTHGNSGFLPYDYVRRLPEYTCVVYGKPNLKVVHAFDECILEFPTTPHPVGSSKQHMQEAFLMRKYCYQCYQRFSDDGDIYILSPGCRGEASLTRYWYQKMMKALDRYLRNTADYIDDETIFIIDP